MTIIQNQFLKRVRNTKPTMQTRYFSKFLNSESLMIYLDILEMKSRVFREFTGS